MLLLGKTCYGSNLLKENFLSENCSLKNWFRLRYRHTKALCSTMYEQKKLLSTLYITDIIYRNEITCYRQEFQLKRVLPTSYYIENWLSEHYSIE